MKRQRFRLGSVLKHYELQKQRAEHELMRAVHALAAIDTQIANWEAEIADLAGFADSATASAAAWVAYWRKSEHLGQRLADARGRRVTQAQVVAKCAEIRKRWAVAVETLLSLREKVDLTNEEEAAKAEQLQLQDSVVRRWLNETPVA